MCIAHSRNEESWKETVSISRCVMKLRVRSTADTSALRSALPGCIKKSQCYQCVFRASSNSDPKSPFPTSRGKKVKQWKDIKLIGENLKKYVFFLWKEEAGSDLATWSCICADYVTVPHFTRPRLLCSLNFDFVFSKSYFILSPKWQVMVES